MHRAACSLRWSISSSMGHRARANSEQATNVLSTRGPTSPMIKPMMVMTTRTSMRVKALLAMPRRVAALDGPVAGDVAEFVHDRAVVRLEIPVLHCQRLLDGC